MKTRNVIAAATVLLGSAATAQQAPAIPRNAPPLFGSTVDQSQAQSSNMARINQRALDEQLVSCGVVGDPNLVEATQAREPRSDAPAASR